MLKKIIYRECKFEIRELCCSWIK